MDKNAKHLKKWCSFKDITFLIAKLSHYSLTLPVYLSFTIFLILGPSLVKIRWSKKKIRWSSFHPPHHEHVCIYLDIYLPIWSGLGGWISFVLIWIWHMVIAPKLVLLHGLQMNNSYLREGSHFTQHCRIPDRMCFWFYHSSWVFIVYSTHG